MGISHLLTSLESVPIGDGDLVGQPFQCLPYQRRFLRGAFAPGVLRTGLSLARGGGKTGLASALGLDSFRPAGVLHHPGFEAVLIASSFQQARLGFEAVKTSLELMGEDGEYRIRDQQNLADIQHKRTKARLRVAGASTWQSAMSRASGAPRRTPGGGDPHGARQAQGGVDCGWGQNDTVRPSQRLFCQRAEPVPRPSCQRQ